jgi:hypothetical protein
MPTPPPYRTPAPRPPPTRKSEVTSVWMSVLLVGGSFAVLLPLDVYLPPLVVPTLAIPAFRAKALNPKSSLLGYLIWIGFCVWAVLNVPGLLDGNASVWVPLACMAILANVPLVFAHWAAFRRLRQSAD